MEWPPVNVEERDAREFTPPHCPNRKCDHHAVANGEFPWIRFGSYVRPSDQREIPRYRCCKCGRTFSQQTFSCTYWLKRRELLARIGAQIVAGSCLRQIGRTLGCSHATAARHVERIGRHGILLHVTMLEVLRREARLGSTFCYDHFETFAIEQLLPLAIGTLIDKRSGLLVSIDGAQHVRGGTKTPVQRKRWAAFVEAHGRPPRGAYTLATKDMLTRLERVTYGEIELLTDDHAAYRVAVKHSSQRARIKHRAFRNPTTKERRDQAPAARNRDRALRPVDQLHSLLRHSHAHDRRETIAFARRHNAALERAFVLAAWRNWIKRRAENDVHSPTPAQAAGLEIAPWTWPRLLAQRLFPDRLPVPDSLLDIYRRDITWPAIRKWTRHRLKYAY